MDTSDASSVAPNGPERYPAKSPFGIVWPPGYQPPQDWLERQRDIAQLLLDPGIDGLVRELRHLVDTQGSDLDFAQKVVELHRALDLPGLLPGEQGKRAVDSIATGRPVSLYSIAGLHRQLEPDSGRAAYYEHVNIFEAPTPTLAAPAPPPYRSQVMEPGRAHRHARRPTRSKIRFDRLYLLLQGDPNTEPQTYDDPEVIEGLAIDDGGKERHGYNSRLHRQLSRIRTEHRLTVRSPKAQTEWRADQRAWNAIRAAENLATEQELQEWLAEHGGTLSK